MIKIFIRDNIEIVYSKNEYIAFKDRDNEYVIYNTNKPFAQGHSHIKSERRMKEVIRHSISKSFPLSWSNYFIHTMIRLTTDDNYKQRLENLRDTRKRKGRKQDYNNIGGRGA